MLLNFIDELRAAGIPASLKEHLVLLEALDRDVIEQTPEAFYYLSRATFVKDEGLLDRFDQVFQKVFKGAFTDYGQQPVDIPEEWLKRIAERYFSEEEMEKIKALGSWDEIMDTLKKRLEEQQGRHQGGNKWIGTGGTSPFGNSGYNPEGIRIGGESRNKRAIRSGKSANSPISTIPGNLARATSRWHCAACAALPAKARPRSSISRKRSAAQPSRAGSTCTCAPSGTMRSRSCCSWTSAVRWTRSSS